MNGYCIIVDTGLMASRLPRCLATLRNAIQHFPGRTDVRVVSHSHNARLATLSRRFGARFEAFEQGSIGARGNAAVSQSPGEALVFLAPRSKLGTNWLSDADRLLSEHAWDAVVFKAPRHDRTRGLRRLWRTPLMPGTLCVRRQWFERIGGFDPTLDDTAYQDLIDRLRACQARVIEVTL
ncbi:hypothetical protein [Aidingimonas halophila]|uniref:Glycosyltransferase family 2 protein n=1 Tax=Aidingimonas halophila TaxID=574349 RepID=A0A1H3FNA9_9GAMM|nr:hypothetical protein [Aidingimonas halophila]GHC38215.1 hypothetical protein GCM10008094_34470 [Aidingimonas halophila]SDX92532.1 hypothetical protein SAMN05443545_10895 [Aidingimonas halophila]